MVCEISRLHIRGPCCSEMFDPKPLFSIFGTCFSSRYTVSSEYAGSMKLTMNVNQNYSTGTLKNT
jgi:hypothetical protein